MISLLRSFQFLGIITPLLQHGAPLLALICRHPNSEMFINAEYCKGQFSLHTLLSKVHKVLHCVILGVASTELSLRHHTYIFGGSLCWMLEQESFTEVNDLKVESMISPVLKVETVVNCYLLAWINSWKTCTPPDVNQTKRNSNGSYKNWLWFSLIKFSVYSIREELYFLTVLGISAVLTGIWMLATACWAKQWSALPLSSLSFHLIWF